MAIHKALERRKFGRRPVYKAAIADQGDVGRLQVMVTDISDGGAYLKAPEPKLVAKEFYLEIPEDDFIVKCRIKRVESTAIGVEFIKSPRRLSWIGK